MGGKYNYTVTIVYTKGKGLVCSYLHGAYFNHSLEKLKWWQFLDFAAAC